MQDADAPHILTQLEQLAAKMGIEIRYELLGRDDDEVPTESGLCIVHKNPLILVDRRLDARARATALVRELKKFDLTTRFIPPNVRRLLEDPSDTDPSDTH